MLDWTNKELIDIYHYSDYKTDRWISKQVKIKGRTYDKFGEKCATTVAILEYKVSDPSTNNFKTAFLVGVARQNPYDSVISLNEGYEIATENAMINPQMILVYDSRPSAEVIDYLVETFINSLPIKFVKTKEEIKSNKNFDYNRYSRLKSKDYYTQYMADCRKLEYYINNKNPRNQMIGYSNTNKSF